MPSCLGIYIENNIIKYAKVSKERDLVKIEASGVKFYEDAEETIKKIANETFSYKTPISINLSDEKYIYSDVFSLLNTKDMEKAVDTEFDYFCNENGKNRNALEYRKMYIQNTEDADKKTVLYSYIDKSSLASKKQLLDDFKLSNIAPLPIIIKNLNKFENNRNIIIVNIEKTTSITTIKDGNLYRVDKIEKGMKDILEEITNKENSYEKAYQICKNSTIYTTAGKNLQTDEDEYMDNIMPNLYSIIGDIKEIIITNGIRIDNIYITGLGAVINNIDLYFQENFEDQKCEILAPYFIEKTNTKLNIKDYIEVNSAISLALHGIGEGEKEIDFIKKSSWERFYTAMTSDIGGGGKSSKKGDSSSIGDTLSNLFKFDLGTQLDNTEKWMIRLLAAILTVIVIYSIFTKIIISQIANKSDEIQEFSDYTQVQINNVSQSTQLVEAKTRNYTSLLEKIREANEKLTATYTRKNAIPNLLTNVMSSIPKEVQLLSIKNSSGKQIQIEAQAKAYENLGYFIAKLKNDAILLNVTSTSGTKSDGYIRITIQGNLPY